MFFGTEVGIDPFCGELGGVAGFSSIGTKFGMRSALSIRPTDPSALSTALLKLCSNCTWERHCTGDINKPVTQHTK